MSPNRVWFRPSGLLGQASAPVRLSFPPKKKEKKKKKSGHEKQNNSGERLSGIWRKKKQRTKRRYVKRVRFVGTNSSRDFVRLQEVKKKTKKNTKSRSVWSFLFFFGVMQKKIKTQLSFQCSPPVGLRSFAFRKPFPILCFFLRQNMALPMGRNRL